MRQVTRIANRIFSKTAPWEMTPRSMVVSIGLLLANAAVADTFDLNSSRAGAPVRHADGSETFQLHSGECNDLEYFSTELDIITSDCARELNRIEYFETSTAGEGDRRLYQWDIFIPEDFRYSAFSERLTAVQFKTATDMLYGFELNNEGYTFRTKNCISAEDFGRWHSVSVRVHYDATRRKSLKDQTPGVFVVECDGKVIVDSTGRPNVAEGGEIQFRYGLFGARNLSETDNVSVSYRNVRISDW